MTVLNLEDRIRRLENIEAIKLLMARYALYINKGWHGKVVNVEEMPSIYATDAKWESADMNLSVTGLYEIMDSIRKETASVDFSMHSFTNPIIEVEDDRGTGNWLMWIINNTAGVARQVYISMDLTYRRTAEGWRIQTVNLQVGTVVIR